MKAAATSLTNFVSLDKLFQEAVAIAGNFFT
jgi:hypothetical protein